VRPHASSRRFLSTNEHPLRMIRTTTRVVAVLAAGLLAMAAPPAHAQDIEPRAYSNAPVGVNFLVAGYAWTQGGVAFDPSLPVTNPDLNTSSAVLAYARVLDLWGKSAKFDVIVPYTRLSGTAEFMGQRNEHRHAGRSELRLNATTEKHFLSANFGPAIVCAEGAFIT
jgi:hypothetical protein